MRLQRGRERPTSHALVCRSGNASKGTRRLYEFCATATGGLKAAKCDVPRLAEGKYLKLLYELFDHAGVLGAKEDDIHARFCPGCDFGPVCAKEHPVGKLSPLCLDGVATAVLGNPS